MKNTRLVLYLGLLNIWLGWVTKAFNIDFISPAVFFSIGGSVKLVYIGLFYYSKRIKPGPELIFLGTGLLLLALGIILRNYSFEIPVGWTIIVIAILFKGIFLVFFFQKIRKHKRKEAYVSCQNQL